MTNTISEEQAIDDTRYWREFYGQGMHVDPNGPDVFRGFRIPIADFEDLLNKAREIDIADPGNPVVAVRAYLARRADGPDKDQMHVVFVPVVQGEDPEIDPYGVDKLSFDGSSSIYDFTTPCPEQCDKQSLLYSYSNVVQ